MGSPTFIKIALNTRQLFCGAENSIAEGEK
jgi:hypothetical protein